jgi:hypothetical protein
MATSDPVILSPSEGSRHPLSQRERVRVRATLATSDPVILSPSEGSRHPLSQRERVRVREKRVLDHLNLICPQPALGG